MKATIFDVDGTLIDSVDLHAKAWQETFARFGRVIAFEDVRSQIGKGGDQLMPVFFSKEELAKIGKDMEEHRRVLFQQKFLPRIRAFPGVRDLFERIRKDGMRIVLASSAIESELSAYRKIADIEDLINASTSSDDADKSKPHPDIFEAALQKLPGVTPTQTIVIGDTPYDAEAARKAGLKTIGMLCGGFGADLLLEAGCIALFEDPRDLYERYDESPLAHSV